MFNYEQGTNIDCVDLEITLNPYCFDGEDEEQAQNGLDFICDEILTPKGISIDDLEINLINSDINIVFEDLTMARCVMQLIVDYMKEKKNVYFQHLLLVPRDYHEYFTAQI